MGAGAARGNKTVPQRDRPERRSPVRPGVPIRGGGIRWSWPRRRAQRAAGANSSRNGETWPGYFAAGGAEVRAPLAGQVVSVDQIGGFQSVLLDHGNGWRSSLFGLGDVEYAVGDSICRGDLLGSLPEAPGGQAQLRLGISYDGRALDPAAMCYHSDPVVAAPSRCYNLRRAGRPRPRRAIDGGCGLVVKAPGCGPGDRGFKSPHPPHRTRSIWPLFSSGPSSRFPSIGETPGTSGNLSQC